MLWVEKQVHAVGELQHRLLHGGYYGCELHCEGAEGHKLSQQVQQCEVLS